MNWENSKSLTPLKKDFLLAFFSMTQDFYLTGGSALSIFYLDHRRSYDLDLFTLKEINWPTVEDVFVLTCQQIGASGGIISSSPMFRRYKIDRDSQSEVVDFVVEITPQIEPEKNVFGDIAVDTFTEIGINKICSLAGRSEVKDLIDLYYLAKEKHFNVCAAIPLAQRKEGGISPAVFSWVLAEMDIDELPLEMIKETSVEEIRKFKEGLAMQIAGMAHPNSTN